MSGCFKFLACLLLITWSVPVWSQVGDAVEETVVTTAELPSPASLDARILSVENDASLDAEAQSRAKGFLEEAKAALLRRDQYLQSQAQIEADLDDIDETIERLNAELDELRNAAPLEVDVPESMDAAALTQLERQLAERETELIALRTQAAELDRDVQTLAARPNAITRELEEARTVMSTLDVQLAELDNRELDRVETARRDSLRVRRAARNAQIAALLIERPTITSRQRLYSVRRDIARLRAERLEPLVEFLQGETGQLRQGRARAMTEAAATMAADTANAHPLLGDYAEENLNLARQLETLAGKVGELPRLSARIQEDLDLVQTNLSVTEQLTELGDLDRRSSATLRRLRSALPVIPAVRADVQTARDIAIQATQDQLLARERLRNLPLGRAGAADLTALYAEENPDAPAVPAASLPKLEALYETRREVLAEIAETASERASEAGTLTLLSEQLLTSTVELKETLDSNLLWLPSVPAIGLDWPGKVVRGTFELFSPANFSLVLSVLAGAAVDYWPVTAILLLISGILFVMRPRFRADIAQLSGEVGSVRQDGYFHTPRALLDAIAIAAPLPILVQLGAILLNLSDHPSILIRNLEVGLETVAIALLFFLTWMQINRDNGVAGTHLGMTARSRRLINRHLKWFLPIVCAGTIIINIAADTRRPDVYEGVSVLAFLIATSAITTLSWLVLWKGRECLAESFDADGFFRRRQRPLSLFLTAVPIAAFGLTLAGYYDTAAEILDRIFLSACLVISVWVVYGILRRSVTVAHRRLSLRQAQERREAAIAARKAKREAAIAAAAAEESGEVIAEFTPPPPIDVEQIDVETIDRQTRQLITTGALISFFALMWLIWRDLLPALSVLDDVRLYSGGERTETQLIGGETIEITEKVRITLWDIVKSIFALTLTVLAVRNLPGFLDAFVLKRAGLDAGSRYAAVNVLKYIIIAIGIVVVLSLIGLQWGQLGFIVAALGVGIGFGLQEIIANFISGLIILFERPVRIGDYVTIGDQAGTVSRIQIRATTLTDLDNREILIPNKELITGRVTNWTLSNSVLRLIIPVGIAYGSDTVAARDIMQKVLNDEAKVLDTPPPQALFVNFGDSSLDFELRVFIKSFEDRFPVIHAVHTNINKALEAANITIPFPQRDLNIMTQDVPLEFVNRATNSPPRSVPKSA